MIATFHPYQPPPRPTTHYGEFKYWPQVYELWYTRKYGVVANRHIYSKPQYSCPPTELEMRDHCGRRR